MNYPIIKRLKKYIVVLIGSVARKWSRYIYPQPSFASTINTERKALSKESKLNFGDSPLVKST